uniref:Uncharacterized protein n=1 Tax=Oryza sativa subsp. japonica TaxID=39947 RepID=Q6YX19_ORYSJ|nr:hypothetical protein [Oryza sativa Japonica Group]BAD16999.1 hypothetical protein [Oryza sativa Japonica Group]
MRAPLDRGTRERERGRLAGGTHRAAAQGGRRPVGSARPQTGRPVMARAAAREHGRRRRQPAAGGGGGRRKGGGGGARTEAAAIGSSGADGERGKKVERGAVVGYIEVGRLDVAGSGGSAATTWRGGGGERGGEDSNRIPSVRARAWTGEGRAWGGDVGTCGRGVGRGCGGSGGVGGGFSSGWWRLPEVRDDRQVGPTCRRPGGEGREITSGRPSPLRSHPAAALALHRSARRPFVKKDLRSTTARRPDLRARPPLASSPLILRRWQSCVASSRSTIAAAEDTDVGEARPENVTSEAVQPWCATRRCNSSAIGMTWPAKGLTMRMTCGGDLAGGEVAVAGREAVAGILRGARGGPTARGEAAATPSPPLDPAGGEAAAPPLHQIWPGGESATARRRREGRQQQVAWLTGIGGGDLPSAKSGGREGSSGGGAPPPPDPAG